MSIKGTQFSRINNKNKNYKMNKFASAALLFIAALKSAALLRGAINVLPVAPGGILGRTGEGALPRAA